MHLQGGLGMDKIEAEQWEKLAVDTQNDLRKATDLILNQQNDIRKLIQERDKLMSVMARMAAVSEKQDAMLQQFYPETKVQ
jgi:hypothetical protein